MIIAVSIINGIPQDLFDGKPLVGNNHKQLQEVPTQIQEGVMTTKQKVHSKLFKSNRYSTGRRILDLVSKRSDLELEGPISDVIRLPHIPLGEILTTLKCKVDVVVIGTVKSKSSHLMESETFVFTDYEVVIDDILKNNTLAPIQQGNNITITRAGGAVSLRGHIVRAIDKEVSRLQLGERYLLYCSSRLLSR